MKNTFLKTEKNEVDYLRAPSFGWGHPVSLGLKL